MELKFLQCLELHLPCGFIWWCSLEDKQLITISDFQVIPMYIIPCLPGFSNEILGVLKGSFFYHHLKAYKPLTPE